MKIYLKYTIDSCEGYIQWSIIYNNNQYISDIAWNITFTKFLYGICSEANPMGWIWTENNEACTVCAIDYLYTNNNSFRRCVMWVYGNDVVPQSNSFSCIGIGY